MYCPGCTSEYRDGLTRCSSCELDLVESLTREPDVQLLKVFETRNAAVATVYESLLVDGGIEYVASKGGGQDLSFGPAEFHVTADVADEARQLAAVLEQSPEPDHLEQEGDAADDLGNVVPERPQTKANAWLSLAGGTALAGLAVGVLLVAPTYLFVALAMVLIAASLCAPRKLRQSRPDVFPEYSTWIAMLVMGLSLYLLPAAAWDALRERYPVSSDPLDLFVVLLGTALLFTAGVNAIRLARLDSRR